MKSEFYIIVDLISHRFAAEKGWVTNREYAKLFTKKEVHENLEKFRNKNFKKVSFERVETPREYKVKEQRLNAVKTAVKQEIEAKKSIIITTEKANYQVINK
jgi:hypothetical protein